MSETRRHIGRWIIGAVIVVVVLAVGIPFVYIHFVEGPAPSALKLPTPTTSPGATPDSTGAAGPEASTVEGTWTVAAGSKVGYRVHESLLGQSSTAVGRTDSVRGTFTLSGTTVTAGTFTVDMTTVTSDQSMRDGQFQGRIMDTATYPTAGFTLTEPIALGTLPAVGSQAKVTATGKLTLHGTTRTVQVPLTVQRSTSTIDVLGSLQITFADWNIDNPSGGPASVGDSGTLEFLLVFQRGAAASTTTQAPSRSGGGGFGPVTLPSTTLAPFSL